MYARITVLEWKMGQKHEGMQEMLQLLRDRIVPTAKLQQGFKGCLGLLDRREGKAMAITLWEMETDLQASEVSGYYFFSSRGRHTIFDCDWSSDVCSSD